MLSQIIRNTFIATAVILSNLSISNQKAIANDLRNFVFYNNNSLRVTHLYVSPSYSDYWGRNILNSSLLSGESTVIKFHDSNIRCIYDFKAIYTNKTYDQGRINLCTSYVVYVYGYGGEYANRR